MEKHRGESKSPCERCDASRAFIVWEPSNSRSDTIAREFAATCHNIHFLSLKKPFVAPLKYLLQSCSTLAVLVKQKPQVVFVQNPPLFAPLVAWVYCKAVGAALILDSHTGVFVEPKWRWLSALHRFLARRATVNIVTNDHLRGILEDWGARAFVLADVPVDVGTAVAPLKNPATVTVINTFSYDEPLDEVLRAARALPEVRFRVTGDASRCDPALLESAGPNVKFTGFLSRQDYVATVAGSAAAVVLTTADHTMQRGAYEAMSMGVPIITSDWPLLRETFCKGTIHVDNRAASIASAVRKVLACRATYVDEIVDLRRQRRLIWSDKRAEFMQRFLPSATDRRGSVDAYG